LDSLQGMETQLVYRGVLRNQYNSKKNIFSSNDNSTSTSFTSAFQANMEI